MDLFLALQCRAMLGVVKPTRESWYRHVARWYSKNFATPLHQVFELPVNDVLLAYYEQVFEDMSEEDREEHLEKLTETEEERIEREKQEAAADDAGEDFFETLNKQVADDMAKGKPVLQVGKKRRTKEKLPGKLTSFSTEEKVSGNRLPPPEPVTPRPAPPEPMEPLLDMKFDDLPPPPALPEGADGNLDSSFEQMLEQDTLGPSRKKR